MVGGWSGQWLLENWGAFQVRPDLEKQPPGNEERGGGGRSTRPTMEKSSPGFDGNSIGILPGFHQDPIWTPNNWNLFLDSNEIPSGSRAGFHQNFNQNARFMIDCTGLGKVLILMSWEKRPLKYVARMSCNLFFSNNNALITSTINSLSKQATRVAYICAEMKQLTAKIVLSLLIKPLRL